VSKKKKGELASTAFRIKKKEREEKRTRLPTVRIQLSGQGKREKGGKKRTRPEKKKGKSVAVFWEGGREKGVSTFPSACRGGERGNKKKKKK